jgi:hypothetical protein
MVVNYLTASVHSTSALQSTSQQHVVMQQLQSSAWNRKLKPNTSIVSSTSSTSQPKSQSLAHQYSIHSTSSNQGDTTGDKSVEWKTTNNSMSSSSSSSSSSLPYIKAGQWNGDDDTGVNHAQINGYGPVLGTNVNNRDKSNDDVFESDYNHEMIRKLTLFSEVQKLEHENERKHLLDQLDILQKGQGEEAEEGDEEGEEEEDDEDNENEYDDDWFEQKQEEEEEGTEVPSLYSKSENKSVCTKKKTPLTQEELSTVEGLMYGSNTNQVVAKDVTLNDIQTLQDG